MPRRAPSVPGWSISWSAILAPQPRSTSSWRFTPSLQRAAGGVEPVYIPGTIPTLVPGQEWRTFWDTGMGRHDSELPEHHDATIAFTDSRGERHILRSVIDWGAIASRDVITAYGPHQTAEALRDISKTIKRWQESSGGLSVYSRDGDARDQRRRDEMKRHRQARDQGDTA
jgi:hypothetical protein